MSGRLCRGPVAQWQSSRLLICGFRVQVPAGSPTHRYLSRRIGAHAPRPSTLGCPRRVAHCDSPFGLRYFDHAATRRTGGNRGVGHGLSIGRRSRESSVSEIPLKGHEPSNHDPSASTRDASGGTYRPVIATIASLEGAGRSSVSGVYSPRADRCAGTGGELVLRLQPFGGRHTTAGRPPRSTREKDRVILPQSAHLANSRSTLIVPNLVRQTFARLCEARRCGAPGHRSPDWRVSPARHLDCRRWGSTGGSIATASKASGWSFGRGIVPPAMSLRMAAQTRSPTALGRRYSPRPRDSVIRRSRVGGCRTAASLGVAWPRYRPLDA